MQAKRARHRAAAPCCSLPAAANAGLATTQGHHARARAHAQRGRCVQKQHAVCCLAGCPSVWLAGWPVVAVCGARFVYTPPSPYRCLPCTMFHVAPCCPLALIRKIRFEIVLRYTPLGHAETEFARARHSSGAPQPARPSPSAPRLHPPHVHRSSAASRQLHKGAGR